MSAETGRKGRRWPKVLLAPLAGLFLSGCLGKYGSAETTAHKHETDPPAQVEKGKLERVGEIFLMKPDVPPPPVESMTLRPEGFVRDKPLTHGSVEEELAGAREL